MTNRRTIPLSALRAFESAATYLNFSKAGTDLGVTHGAISHHVRALEEKLKTKLFVRGGDHLALTPMGDKLYQTAKSGFDILGCYNSSLGEDKISGSLVIGCTPTISMSWATQHICEFNDQYPEVEVSVREIHPLQKSIANDIDVAICYGRPDTKNRVVTKLAEPSVYPYCNPQLLRKCSGAITRVKDLSKFWLIYDHQAQWNTWLYAHSLASSIFRKIYFPNTTQAMNAARLGHGIVLGNTLETKEFTRTGNLVRVLNKHIEESEDYYLVTHDRASMTHREELFKNWVVKACLSY